MRINLLIILISFSFSSFAVERIGTILRHKGDATLLLSKPAQTEARKIKEGEPYYTDSSILTSENSYATIKLNDTSYIKIGKESKVSVLFEKDQKTYVVYLYTGHVEVLFVNTNEVDKMKVKTTNATAEFSESRLLMTYNPLLQISSVINYKGESKFYRKDQPQTSVKLAYHKQSYLDRTMDEPENPKRLSDKRHKEILEKIKIKAKKTEDLE